MKRKTLTTVAAGLGVTIVLSACGSGSTHTSRPASTSPPTTAVRAPSLLPEPTGTFAVGVRTVPSVSPAATTRVWYPAVAGTGTGTAVHFSGKTLAAYGVPATQLQGVVPRASVDAEPAPTTNAPSTRAIIDRTATAVAVKLRGATHFDVTDVPWLVPAIGDAAKALGLGTIGRAGTTTTNAIVLRFLDAVLNGKPTPTAAALANGLAAATK